MSRQTQQAYTPPIEASIITALVTVSALLGGLFAGNYLLRWLVDGKGIYALVIGGLLASIVAVSALVTLGLRRLKPWAWYAGVGLFVAAAAVALVVFVLKLSFLAFGYLLLNVITAAYVYHTRPIYTPGTQARYDAYYDESILYRFHLFRQMRQNDQTPLGVKLLAVVATLASLLAFVQALRLLWMGKGASIVLGVLVIAAAAVQTYTVYGLWMLERWAWFAGLALFGLATVFAGFRVVLFGGAPMSLFELAVNGLITGYIYWKKPLYAPRVTIDLTPR